MEVKTQAQRIIEPYQKVRKLKGHNMPQKYHFRAYTNPGTKKELIFATDVLGKEDVDWAWMNKRAKRIGKQLIPQFAVGMRKEEYDRIKKKQARMAHELKVD